MSALEEIERQLLKSVAERAQTAERDARVQSEYAARPVRARRRRRGWRSLWSGGRLGVVLAAVVLAGGVAAAAVLLDQPSAPLSGRVPAGQQPGYAVAGGYRYRISLVPSLEVGRIGWCAAITTTSKSGQLESLGTGSCGDAPTSGTPLFAPQVGQGLSFVFTTASVHAIQLPGHRPVLTTSARLLFGYRAAVFQYVEPTDGLPSVRSNEQFGIAALDASGQQIPYDGSGMPNEPTKSWGTGETPAAGSCSVTARAGANLTFGVGSVVTSIVPAPRVVGAAFLSCLERNVRLDSTSPSSLPIDERVMQIYVLLNASDPSAPAPGLPYMQPLPGHPGTLGNAELPLPDALSSGMTARRVGNAWLAVTGGRSTQQRLAVLSQISLGPVNLNTSQTGGFESHGCSISYQPTPGFTETGPPLAPPLRLSYRFERTCASTTFYYNNRWPLTASIEKAAAPCPAQLARCSGSAARRGLQVSKVKGHASERVVSIGGTERAMAERIAQGWLIVTGGEGAAQQQLLLSRLTGHVLSAAPGP
jgi:hypothetical protein